MGYSKSKTELHNAVLNNNLEKVRTLVTTMSQEDICKQTKLGYTALHYACYKFITDYFLALIPHVSDESLGYQDKKGNTVLHVLLNQRPNNYIQLIEILIPRMSSEQLHLKNSKGAYILDNNYFSRCINILHVNTIKILLNNMTNDEFGQQNSPTKNTLLHTACYCNNPEVVKLLLLRMTTEQKNLRNNQLHTALDVAYSDEVRNLFKPMVKSAVY